MSPQAKAQLERHIDRVEKKLPRRPAKMLRRVRQPSARYARWAVAAALIAGGLLGFLPVLGFWMVPLGLILIAQDVPFLRPPLARVLGFIERKWQTWKTR
jgi:hypothetical protein